MHGFPCQRGDPFRMALQWFADWFTRLGIPELYLWHRGRAIDQRNRDVEVDRRTTRRNRYNDVEDERRIEIRYCVHLMEMQITHVSIVPPCCELSLHSLPLCTEYPALVSGEDVGGGFGE